MIKVYLYDDIDTYELDTEDISLASFYSLLSIDDIGKRRSSIQSIQLKGTKRNNYAFGILFSLNKSTDLSLNNQLFFNYSPIRGVNCIVYDNTDVIFKGTLRVNSIKLDEFNGVVYDCVLTNSFVDLKTTLSDKTLSQLDLSDLRHRYSVKNIINSWNTSIEMYSGSTYSTKLFEFGKGYTYPTIDYGHYYSGSSISQNHDIDIRNLRPALYVNEYFNRIFSQPELKSFSFEIQGYDDFVSGFKHLIIPNNNQNNYVSITGLTFDISKSYLVAFSGSSNVSSGNPYKLAPINGINQPYLSTYGSFLAYSNGYNNVLEVKKNFTTSIRIGVNFDCYYDLDPQFLDSFFQGRYNTGQMEIQLVSRNYKANNNSNDDWSVIAVVPVVFSARTYERNKTNILSFNNISFVQGSQIALRVNPNFNNAYKINVGTGQPEPYSTTYWGLVSASIEFPSSSSNIIEYEPIPSLSTTGSTGELIPISPIAVKQIDFLKSVVSQLNLVVYSTQDQPKRIKFAQYDWFYRYFNPSVIKNYALNWTGKIDYSKGYQIKSNLDLPKSYKFSGVDDEDYYSTLYKSKYSSQYGQKEFTDSYGIQPQKSVSTIFSPSIVSKDQQTDKVFPKLYKIDNNVKKTVKTQPKLFYYNYSKVSNPYKIYYFSGSTLSSITQSNYSYASNYYEVSGASASTVVQDVNFDRPSEVYFPASSSYINAPTAFSFYSSQILSLTNPDSKILSLKARLNSIDIANLDFSIPIFLSLPDGSNSYFRLISVEYSNDTDMSDVVVQSVVF